MNNQNLLSSKKSIEMSKFSRNPADENTKNVLALSESELENIAGGVKSSDVINVGKGGGIAAAGLGAAGIGLACIIAAIRTFFD